MSRSKSLLRKKIRIRKKIRGSREIPRVSVFKSLRSVYVQAIDDVKGYTISSAMVRNGSNKGAFKEVGKLLSLELKKANVVKLKFDRNGLKYHGAIKELAESLRGEGFVF